VNLPRNIPKCVRNEVPPLRSEFLATERRCIVFPVRYELNLCYVEESRPHLWSSGQSSWLQIQSLVSTTEELLGRKRSGSGLENREYGRRDP
jgi:hypothetical protein